MSELIKLFLILFGGFLVIVIGFIVQKKQIAKKRAELDMMSQNYSSTSEEISEAEQVAKNYIETYKNQFPKDSIKEGLIQTGNNEADIESWLNKYL